MTDWNDHETRTQQLIATDIAREASQDMQQFVPTHRAAQFNIGTSVGELKGRVAWRESCSEGHGRFRNTQEDYGSAHDRSTWSLAEWSQSQERPASKAQTILPTLGQDVGLVQSSRSDRAGRKFEESAFQQILPRASAKERQEDLGEMS